ncbi:MAG: metal-dependent hydrolase [Bryobacterales bacterium]|nr:metal-dependent hydrolase [Acidobacteriota bacterium]MCB9383023.1 metal-dependent hydrolase [Bryobacterales bacterium]
MVASMSVSITWLGHSTFEIRLPGGETILIDPWLDNPKRPAGHKLERVDLLLVTHGHFDHIADAVDVAKKFKPQVAANFEVGTWLGSKGVENVTGMNKGGSVELAGFRVSMTHAQHSSMIQDGDQTIYGGEPAGFVVRLPDGRRFYHAGDTNLFSDMSLIRRLWKPELAMLPIGDLFTMDPEQAAIACEFLGAKKVIPMHYGTFPPLTGTPEELSEEIAKLGLSTEVIAPAPGETVVW